MGILAATLSIAAPIQRPASSFSAYYESTIIQFTPAISGASAPASLGPWVFGQRLSTDKPLDKRLNLYVVIPGTQHQSPALPEFDHNLVVNTLTHDKPREWDVYWCLKLDPSLNEDIRGEHELIVAAQQFFHPADLFDMEDIPGRAVLAEKAGVHTLADFKRYRRKDGSLPRMLIIPAHLAVSAATEELKTALPEQAQTDKVR